MRMKIPLGFEKAFSLCMKSIMQGREEGATNFMHQDSLCPSNFLTSIYHYILKCTHLCNINAELEDQTFLVDLFILCFILQGIFNWNLILILFLGHNVIQWRRCNKLAAKRKIYVFQNNHVHPILLVRPLLKRLSNLLI